MQDNEFVEFLDAISICFTQRNFDQWRNRVLYPFSLITSGGPVVLRNDTELRASFDQYLQTCDTMRLDEIVCTPVSLEDCLDGTWIGTYETNLLSNGVRATAPYTSSALLKMHAGSYKMLSIFNARGHHEWTGNRPDRFH